MTQDPHASQTEQGAAVARQRCAQRRNRLALKLTAFHIALVFLYDLAAVHAPALLSLPAWPGAAVTTGLLGALAMVCLVIGAACYYSWRVNRDNAALRRLLKASPPDA